MIKKVLLIICFIIAFAQATFAQDIFRVTSVNFDTSNSLIFLTSPDNTTESIMKNIKLTKLQNPKRVYFDINSAVLAIPPKSWFLSSGGIKQIKINQFSNNPDKIRIVLYLEENFDQSKISFLKVNNNLVIKLKNGQYNNVYYQRTYRDEKLSSNDFYENLSISSEDMTNIKTAVNQTQKEDVLNQIQQAFDSNTLKSNEKTVTVKTPEIIKKELKLKSKYYLNLVTPKSNGFLVSGFGSIGIEKPLYLSNPARVVFDIPNTIINPSVKNQELKIGQDTVKISQYEQNKARIVITSTQLEKYFPIFSADNQSILFVNSDSIDLDTLFNKTTDANSYTVKTVNSNSEEFAIAFSSPVVHSIRRDPSRLTINLYNAFRYNDKTFHNAISNTTFKDLKMDLLPKIGLKLSLPLEKNEVINCYLSADGKSIKISAKGVKPTPQISHTERPIIFTRNRKAGSSVVLDAGHGGSDYGAIRAGINEKDINLDVAKRVQAILDNNGIKAYMTRDNDEFVSLQDRTIITANKSPDVFVSIHVNSANSTEASGIETHYYHPESLELAQTVHESLVNYIKTKDRGLFKSRFYVINHTNVPAILVEIGFISNPAERAELVSESRKQQTAKAVAEGIIKYLNKR